MSHWQSPLPMRERFLRIFGINRTLLLASGPRFTGMLMGPVGSLIIVFTLTTKDQGLYYVFLSLLGLRSFFELGATACIGQMTPHYLDANGKIPDGSMVRVAVDWMRNVSALFAFCGVFAGGAYLASCGHSDWPTLLLWTLSVIPTAFSGIQEGRLQLLYGAGLVNEVSRVRWISQLIQYGIQWSLLLLGFGLASFAVAATGVLIYQSSALRRKFPWSVSGKNDSALASQDRERKRELRGLVKRASIVYMAGYFVFQIQQPILFALCGAEASARFGFSLVILNSLIGLSSLWGMTVFPEISRSVALGRVDAAFLIFRTTWLRTAAVATIGLVASGLAIAILGFMPRFSDRLLPFAGFAPLGLAIWLQALANAAIYWPRAFREEPFAPVSLVQMIITPPAVWLAITQFGPNGVGWGNLASWLVGIVMIMFITVRFLPHKLPAATRIH